MKKDHIALSPIKKVTNSKIDLTKLIKRGNSFGSKKFKKLLSKKAFRHSVDLITSNPKKPVIPKMNPTPVDLCLYALDHAPNQRDSECLQYIINYLKSLPSFMNIISKEKNLKLSENLIEQISIHLRHEYIPKNNIVCRFGERGEKFYIILKGKVKFFIPKVQKCYLNFEEYILYLMRLRKNDELGLINNIISQNQAIFPIEDDNFDLFILNEFQRNQKIMKKFVKSKTKVDSEFKSILYSSNNNINNKEFSSNNNNKTIDKKDDSIFKKKKKFSVNTYKKMKEVVDKITNINLIFNENEYLGENSPSYYMKSNNEIDLDLESKGRKLVNVYKYEEMSTFENGQNFGYIALQSKSCKRAATAIVIQDSHLGVLTKEEFLKFFEMLSNKEKTILFELLKFYNILGQVSEHKFVKKYYHYFEYIKFRKNNTIMDINKPINELILFNSGLFVVNIFLNLIELNDLITKIKLIRGKILGLSNEKLEIELDEQRENQDFILRKNYLSSNETKMLSKKYNFTLSIISDHLIIGYPDTVDPFTFKPLFNCTCLSAESDGYYISNRSIKLINEDSKVILSLKSYCLMKIEYNLNRLQQFKKEIVSKIKKNEISSFVNPKGNKAISFELNNNKENALKDINNSENRKVVKNLCENKKYIFDRNKTFKKRSRNNNKKPLSLKFNTINLENALYRYNRNKNEEIKNNKEREKRKSIYQSIRNSYNPNNFSKVFAFKKLRESTLEKQKKPQFKKEECFKTTEYFDYKSDQKEKVIVNKNLNSEKNEDNKKRKNYNNDSFINKIKYSLSHDFFFCDYFSKTQKNMNKKLYKKEKNKIDLYSNKIEADKYKINSLLKDKVNQLTLPFIDKNKDNYFNKESDFMYLTSIKTFDETKIKKVKNNNLKLNENSRSYDDTYRLTELSPFSVKEKYIIFKSFANTNEKQNSQTITDIRKNKFKEAKPIKLQKNDNLETLLYKDNKKNFNKENKTNDYNNIKTSNKKIKNNYFIKGKINELNDLVESIQQTTKEILDIKNDL